jgi:histidinol-phosphate/aromatic aminotransferase/cobyric acid decarboxylase-like protein
MIPPNALEPLMHGGDLDAARNLFPGAPEPFLDLSTGINPHPYPIPKLPPEIFAALRDTVWMERTQSALGEAAHRLDGMLREAGLEKIGGTSLFSLVRGLDAQQVFDRLGRAGVFVRRFAEEPHWLRFGLPGAEADWLRLAAALRR